MSVDPNPAAPATASPATAAPATPAPAPPAPATPAPATPAPATAASHAFDAAIHLSPESEGVFHGQTHPAYGNMVGPFGGITAATLLNAAWLHPSRLGEPVALTVNYAGPVADGAFVIAARAVRTNRSTQHWFMELTQGGEVACTATAVFAVRRDTWGAAEAGFPDVLPADAVERARDPGRVAWIGNYDMRFVQGAFPGTGREAAARAEAAALSDSVSCLWIRDWPPRPLDFMSLAAICDSFFPRIYLRRPKLTPAGTVSMTICFHADSEALAQQGDRPVLGKAKALHFGRGYFDQSAEIWSDGGVMLASSHQVVYYRD